VTAAPTAQALAERLARLVGPEHVLVDPAVVEGYVRDWTGRWRGDCALVVRPGDETETAAVLAEVEADGARVVVQGGNTGLVAGAVDVVAAMPAFEQAPDPYGRLDRALLPCDGARRPG
jgi:hypothetical protein